MQTSMSFKFTPNKDDFIKAMRAYSFTRKNSRIQLIITSALFFFMTLALFLLRARFGPLWLFVILAFILLVLYYSLYYPMKIGLQFQSNERSQGEIVWTVDETGVYFATKLGEAKLDWGSFQSYLETKEQFLVFHSSNKRFFSIVPKRAFNSQEEIEVFRQILTVNLEKAQSEKVKQSWLKRNVWKIVDYGMLAIIIIIIFVAIYFTRTHR
jgi:energy-coupling factor transporter transmembrane protein EcfT